MMVMSQDFSPGLDEALTTAQARARLAARLDQELEPLRQLSTLARVRELVFFVALLGLGVALTLAGGMQALPVGVQRVLPVMGIICSAVGLNAFVLLLHEGMHHTLFRQPRWNRWVSVLLGMPLLISFTAYQVMHLRHHHFLGDPRDPDDYANYTASPLRLQLMHCGRLLFGAFLYLLLIPLLAWRHGSKADRIRLLQEYALMAAVWIVVLATVPWITIGLVWGLPVILVGYLTNLRGFAQHGITDAHDPLLASRTIHPHPVVEFCLLNENYHLEHHLFPEVPSYSLPQLHRLIEPQLPRRVTGTSYLAFLARFAWAAVTRNNTPIGLEKRSPAVIAPKQSD